MKRSCVFISLLLMFAVCFSAFATTPVPLSNDAIVAMLEASLQNGFSPQKDVLAMLDNALLNGYDYFEVGFAEKVNNAIMVKVSIDGLTSALLSLYRDESEESKQLLTEAEEAMIAHGKTICNLLNSIGRNDILLQLRFLDDFVLHEYGLPLEHFFIIYYNNGEVIRSSLTLGQCQWHD